MYKQLVALVVLVCSCLVLSSAASSDPLDTPDLGGPRMLPGGGKGRRLLSDEVSAQQLMGAPRLLPGGGKGRRML